MLLLVHPRFLLVHETKHLEKGEKKKKAFCSVYLHCEQG